MAIRRSKELLLGGVTHLLAGDSAEIYGRETLDDELVQGLLVDFCWWTLGSS